MAISILKVVYRVLKLQLDFLLIQHATINILELLTMS